MANAESSPPRPVPHVAFSDTFQTPSSPARSLASNASGPPEPRHLQLTAASLQANEDRVRDILTDHLLWTSSQDRTALRQSLQKVATRGNLTITRLLLEKGADTEPQRDNETAALFRAAEAGYVDVVDELLRHGANANVIVRSRLSQTPLFVACFRGHNRVVEMLLDANADVEVRDKEGRTPLLYLVAERDGANWSMETMSLLLGRGRANCEARDPIGRTPLLWAVTNGMEDVVRALLSGALHGKVADVHATNNRGRSALHLAADSDRASMVRLLLEKGAEINAVSDGGWTALHNAAQQGSVEVVAVLLKANADVNAGLANGMTPLHWAAFNGHKLVVSQLLDLPETQLNLKDSFDRTPMLCAAERRNSDIVWMLYPARTAHRLSKAEQLACQECTATVVDFGNLRDNKKHLVHKPSVFDVLYGWEKDPSNPRSAGRAKVTTTVKDATPDFRWIHLPANNIEWAETLLSKWFIEGGHSDVEHFKSLERCFYQEHRGLHAHSNYMRTYCERFSAFYDPGSFTGSPDGNDRPLPSVPEESSDHLNRTPSVVVTSPTDGDQGPSTPKRVRFDDGDGGQSPASNMRASKAGKTKKKSKSEQIAERHPSHKPRTKGPPGNPPGTKAKNAAQQNHLSMLYDTSKTPELNGKLVLFMPYLHYETDERRQRMSKAIEIVFNNGRPDEPGLDEHDLDEFGLNELGPTRDVMLTRAYLPKTPPLHPRRTLDQFYYRGIDTTTRDMDQVVYRYCERYNLEKKVFMVDQLWMWILGKDLVVTCFPQRWDQPTRDPFDVLAGIIEETNAKTRPPLQSVYDLALLITGRCSGMFDRHRLSDHDYHFLDMFETSIGLVTDTESVLFKRFNDASGKSAQSLNQSASSSHGQAPSSRRSVQSNDTDEDSINFIKADFPDALLDIRGEIQLLAEIKDIRDELNILYMLLTAQKSILTTFEKKIADELASGAGNSGHSSHYLTIKSIIAEISKRSNDQLLLLDTHCYDVDRMFKQAESIYLSLTNLLDLKQKHSNALEARYARESATISARQGQTVLTFTIVTIVFLPISFIASFFSIQLNDLQDKLSVGYVSKYIFGIGLGISIPLIVMAFTVRDVIDASRDVYAAVQKSGNFLSLVSGWRKRRDRAARESTQDYVFGGHVVAPVYHAGLTQEYFAELEPPGGRAGIGSRQSHQSNQPYYDRRGSAQHTIPGHMDTHESLRRTSSNITRPPYQSSRPQHQLHNPPKWFVTAGNSTMRTQPGSVVYHRELRGGSGGGGGGGAGGDGGHFKPDRNHSNSSIGARSHDRKSADLEKGVYRQ